MKLVITPASTDAELEEAWREIAAVDPATPVLLQPGTPFGGVRQRPGAARLLELCAHAERVLADVRVIPQTHPILGAL